MSLKGRREYTTDIGIFEPNEDPLRGCCLARASFSPTSYPAPLCLFFFPFRLFYVLILHMPDASVTYVHSSFISKPRGILDPARSFFSSATILIPW